MTDTFDSTLFNDPFDTTHISHKNAYGNYLEIVDNIYANNTNNPGKYLTIEATASLNDLMTAKMSSITLKRCS